ncbi:MAG: amidase [Beijerinckiaceae bacterium]
MGDPALLSVADMRVAFRAKTVSPVDVAEACYARLDRFEKDINAFCLVTRDTALAQAKASEARWFRNEPMGVLDGIPVTVKDNIPQKGLPRRLGSRGTSAAPFPIEASGPKAMAEAGAVFLGRTTMPEFGWIGHCNSPLTGITRNPWNRNRTTGGSSGGAAAAAALSIGALHIGTDGAGSIRIPAAFTGVFGIKPTYGRVPSHPASSFTVLSHHGPLTRNVGDAAIMMNVISSPDLRDHLAWNAPAGDYTSDLEKGVKGLRIGYSRTLGYIQNLDPEIGRIVDNAVGVFADAGAIVEEVDPGFSDPYDSLEAMWFAGSSVAAKEFSAQQRAELDPGFRAVLEAAEKMDLNRFVNAFASGRGALVDVMNQFHARYDLLLTPMMPVTAFDVGRDVPVNFKARSGPLAWVSWSEYTYPFNLTQQPAASVPCGFTADGLPVGLQIVAPKMRDDRVLQAARAFERERPFRMPDHVRQ